KRQFYKRTNWSNSRFSVDFTSDKMNDGKRNTTANRRLAQWRVTWLIEHSTSHQHLWYIDSFVLRNPPLRQAAERQAVKKNSFLPNHQFSQSDILVLSQSKF